MWIPLVYTIFSGQEKVKRNGPPIMKPAISALATISLMTLAANTAGMTQWLMAALTVASFANLVVAVMANASEATNEHCK